MGISQPAKSTSLAPADWCCVMRGVCCMASSHAAESDVEDYRRDERNDTVGLACTIPKSGSKHHLPLSAHIRIVHPFVPSFGDQPDFGMERGGLSSIDGTAESFSIL